MKIDNFLETKKLVVKNMHEGYIIPYAYLKTLIQEYSDLTNAKLVEENERLKGELHKERDTNHWAGNHLAIANSQYQDVNKQLQSELSAAKERVKELENGCKKALYYIDDDMSIHIELKNLLTPKQQ